MNNGKFQIRDGINHLGAQSLDHKYSEWNCDLCHIIHNYQESNDT